MSGNDDDDDFERQLRLEQQEKASAADGASDPYTYTDPTDGTAYEWDHEKRAWFPKINEDFIAMYQSNYGYAPAPEESTSKSTEPEKPPPKDNNDEVEASSEKEEDSEKQPSSSDAAEVAGSEILKKKGLKNAQKRPATWFELDDAHNTKVYVSGLPTEDFDDEKFMEMMSKYGMLFKDASGKYRAKLYKDANGKLKGDGICTYLKVESVDLAIQLLDGSQMGDQQVHVERARFQMKGEFDPSKKPKPLMKKEKEKLKKKIEKLFAWKPDKLRGERNKWENTVVIRNFFEPQEFDQDPRLVLEYQKDLREECESKFGETKKVVIYDRNPQGVATVTFKDVEHADACITTMKGRFFAGRQLEADHWDGKEKFKIVESEEQLEERMKKWDEFLEKE
ncbi:HIV Tat-specific factor 1 [Galendromus occidentalis]|uniref:HIV Tat-specific factor 1 n=1 Tax=Galendromus occidentalis TaxID=34638 RepID=A0AAJ6VYQ3_9ACAR|nr:HIV Tat-specific factor 1 [Galendromus occidentalis]